jgi:hypothetical protein
MIFKKFNKLGARGNYLNIIEAIYQKLTVHFILNKHEVFFF